MDLIAAISKIVHSINRGYSGQPTKNFINDKPEIRVDSLNAFETFQKIKTYLDVTEAKLKEIEGPQHYFKSS